MSAKDRHKVYRVLSCKCRADHIAESYILHSYGTREYWRKTSIWYKITNDMKAMDMEFLLALKLATS